MRVMYTIKLTIRGWHFRPVLELQQDDHVGEDEAGRRGPRGVVEVKDVHGSDGCPVVKVLKL